MSYNSPYIHKSRRIDFEKDTNEEKIFVDLNGCKNEPNNTFGKKNSKIFLNEAIDEAKTISILNSNENNILSNTINPPKIYYETNIKEKIYKNGNNFTINNSLSIENDKINIRLETKKKSKLALLFEEVFKEKKLKREEGKILKNKSKLATPFDELYKEKKINKEEEIKNKKEEGIKDKKEEEIKDKKEEEIKNINNNQKKKSTLAKILDEIDKEKKIIKEGSKNSPKKKTKMATLLDEVKEEKIKKMNQKKAKKIN